MLKYKAAYRTYSVESFSNFKVPSLKATGLESVACTGQENSKASESSQRGSLSWVSLVQGANPVFGTQPCSRAKLPNCRFTTLKK